MSAGNWIALIGILMTGAVALAIAYMQRKQMRQIELHRTDPEIPLVPPPHAVSRFLKSYGIYIWCIAWLAYDVVLLILDLRKTAPVTPERVVFIVMDIAGIVFNTVLAVSFSFSKRAIEVALEIVRTVGKMTDVLKEMAERMLSLDARITKLEKRETPAAAKE